VTVLSNSADYSFGQRATFQLEAVSSTDITAVYLYIKLEEESRPEQHSVQIQPGTAVSISAERELRQLPFPPFGEVTWWWELQDALGNVWPTSQHSFRYLDNRFEWVARSSGTVTIHTTREDTIYTQQALDVCQRALDQLGSEMGVAQIGQLELYMYPSEESIRSALQMAGHEWVGGQAHPELGVILVAIPHSDGALSRMERDIPHELTHYLVYLRTGANGYPYVPAWLNEGLATSNEWRPDPNLQTNLASAHSQGDLIPLLDLCEPFSADPETAYLSYSQSASIVNYIKQRYGLEEIFLLLDTYAGGAGCEDGISTALGTSAEQLYLAWRANLIGLEGSRAWFAENSRWIILWAAGLLLALPIALSFRRAGQ
jgi:hypothetical protein